MIKQSLKILVINRPFNQTEKPVMLFERYEEKGYDMIIFPFREDKRRTEIIFFSFPIKDDLSILFNVHIDYDPDGGDPFYDFDLEGIDEQACYDILSQRFEISTFNLTDIELTDTVSS